MRVSIGAYYFDGKPVYIVEHIEEDLSEYVIVYNVLLYVLLYRQVYHQNNKLLYLPSFLLMDYQMH
jgi:hypothetical protein